MSTINWPFSVIQRDFYQDLSNKSTQEKEAEKFLQLALMNELNYPARAVELHEKAIVLGSVLALNNLTIC